jgi:hypothetical protein
MSSSSKEPMFSGLRPGFLNSPQVEKPGVGSKAMDKTKGDEPGNGHKNGKEKEKTDTTKKSKNKDNDPKNAQKKGDAAGKVAGLSIPDTPENRKLAMEHTAQHGGMVCLFSPPPPVAAGYVPPDTALFSQLTEKEVDELVDRCATVPIYRCNGVAWCQRANGTTTPLTKQEKLQRLIASNLGNARDVQDLIYYQMMNPPS